MTETQFPIFPTDPEVRALRRSPLHDYRAKFAAASIPEAVEVREIPFLTMFDLRALPDTEAHAGLAEKTGVGLPGTVGEVAGGVDHETGRSVLWISPDEFLLIAPDDPEATAQLFDELYGVIAEIRGDVVNVSSNRTTIEVSGPAAREVLKKFVPTDLHDRVFPVNHAITTTAARNPLLLWRTGEHTWRLLPRASYAEYVALWILDAMREFRQ